MKFLTVDAFTRDRPLPEILPSGHNVEMTPCSDLTELMDDSLYNIYEGMWCGFTKDPRSWPGNCPGLKHPSQVALSFNVDRSCVGQGTDQRDGHFDVANGRLSGKLVTFYKTYSDHQAFCLGYVTVDCRIEGTWTLVDDPTIQGSFAYWPPRCAPNYAL